MRYVIVDLEATCWEKGTVPDRMEIIEIGALLLPSSQEAPSSEFARFVRPLMEPKLSAFCTELTSIRQEDVDRADDFRVVFPEFLDWIGSEPFTLCSWGAYDQRQFRVDCQRYSIPFPSSFEQHINLKQAFAEWKGIRPCGMSRALEILNLPLEGTHHRGIDDARNIAKIAPLLLEK
jgi:inhibitor of KinA sporulation pathway (predicted exonuclease)